MTGLEPRAQEVCLLLEDSEEITAVLVGLNRLCQPGELLCIDVPIR